MVSQEFSLKTKHRQILLLTQFRIQRILKNPHDFLWWSHQALSARNTWKCFKDTDKIFLLWSPPPSVVRISNMWFVFTCGPKPVAFWVLSLCSLDAASNWHLNVFLYLLLSEARADELCTLLTAQTWNRSRGKWLLVWSVFPGETDSWVSLVRVAEGSNQLSLGQALTWTARF